MTSLSDLIRQDFGSSYPIGSGNGTKDDPLIVTELVDYVAVEHHVATHVLKMLRSEFRLVTQGLSRANGRSVDELVFDVKPIGAPDWTGIRRFFFDISAGLSK